MRYSDDIIEEVRSKNDIVDVVSQYVKLTRKGSSYFGLCPFHNEKTPSFSCLLYTSMVSDLGLNPSNDGKIIRLVLPELTEERRKELVKDVKKKGEAAKVAVRNVRRDANDAFKKLTKQDVSEDEVKDLEDQVQKLTDKYIKDIEAAVDKKSKEILTV